MIGRFCAVILLICPTSLICRSPQLALGTATGYGTASSGADDDPSAAFILRMSLSGFGMLHQALVAGSAPPVGDKSSLLNPCRRHGFPISPRALTPLARESVLRGIDAYTP